MQPRTDSIHLFTIVIMRAFSPGHFTSFEAIITFFFKNMETVTIKVAYKREMAAFQKIYFLN